MNKEQQFLNDLAEVLSLADEVKSDPRLEEAKKLVKNQAPFRDGVLKKAEAFKKEKSLKVELNRLVPNFDRYLLIGQASIAVIKQNQQQISLSTIYLPAYRGSFFFADSDSVSKRKFVITDVNERQQVTFQPPLGGTPLETPWLIATPYDDPILSLEQALLVIQHKRSN